jgi:hypothetical protein
VSGKKKKKQKKKKKGRNTLRLSNQVPALIYPPVLKVEEPVSVHYRGF